MRPLILVLASLIHLGSIAQDVPPVPPANDLKWSIGLEQFHQFKDLIGRNAMRGSTVQGAIMYHQNDHKAWRLGYMYHRLNINNGTALGSQAGVTGTHEYREKVNWHQFSFGRQWSFSNCRLRPILGLDALIGVHSSSLFHEWNSDFPNIAASYTIDRKDDLLFLGGAVATGLQLAAHKHLMIELRVSPGYFHVLDLKGSSANDPGLFTIAPGSGLFVHFKF